MSPQTALLNHQAASCAYISRCQPRPRLLSGLVSLTSYVRPGRPCPRHSAKRPACKTTPGDFAMFICLKNLTTPPGFSSLQSQKNGCRRARLSGPPFFIINKRGQAARHTKQLESAVGVDRVRTCGKDLGQSQLFKAGTWAWANRANTKSFLRFSRCGSGKRSPSKARNRRIRHPKRSLAFPTAVLLYLRCTQQCRDPVIDGCGVQREPACTPGTQ